MGGFTLANTVRSILSEVPQIPNLAMPVQPKIPEWINDGQHWDRMQLYWSQMEHYRKERSRFCLDWERAQRNCVEYMYFSFDIYSNRKLVDQDIQDYKCYETYDESLPPAIEYLYECPGTLSFYHFRDLVQKSVITFPTITTAEIRDRSEGDVFSKVITIFQTTSFILQLMARFTLRLPITELKLITFALASLNGIIYFFWWDKPLRVEEPVSLYLCGALPVNQNKDDSEQVRIHQHICALNPLIDTLVHLVPHSSRLSITRSTPRAPIPISTGSKKLETQRLSS